MALLVRLIFDRFLSGAFCGMDFELDTKGIEFSLSSARLNIGLSLSPGRLGIFSLKIPFSLSDMEATLSVIEYGFCPSQTNASSGFTPLTGGFVLPLLALIGGGSGGGQPEQQRCKPLLPAHWPPPDTVCSSSKSDTGFRPSCRS